MQIETVICQRCGQPIPRYNVQGAKLCTDCYREFLEFFRDFLNGTETERAYKIVYNDLMKVDLFRGHYDAKNGSETFVRGIGTVMENIALHVSEETANKYMQEFTNNIQDARKRAKP